MYDQIEWMTKRLMENKSFNNTEGERRKAQQIKDIVNTFPYFEKHPENLWTQEIPDDPHGRFNVFAKVSGNSKRTLLFHAHIDTVGTDDYGILKEHAHDPDFLEAFFSEFEGDDKVKEDARSGKWLFGRGALDMQSGIAVHLANLLYFSEMEEEPDGDLLFLFNPDEESEHAGMIAAIDELYRLKQEGTQFLAAINDDFISPVYDGDCKRYIYTGAAGKLLPCFYIVGREAHVGDILTSIDPTRIASDINLRINQNIELLEDIEGEFVLPPSCLYFKDKKTVYNVQTPLETRMYFNYFVYEKTSKEVLEELVSIAKDSVDRLESSSRNKFEKYRTLHGFPEREVSWKVDVVTFEDFLADLRGKGLRPEEVMKGVLENMKGEDNREIAFSIVEALQQLDPDKTPRVIIFFAPPFLPHNYLNEENEYGKKVNKVLRDCLKKTEEETGEEFEIKRFFPYLADGSFLSLHESDEDIEAFKDNMPMIESLYPVPIDRIRELNIPSINLGVYGRDGHQWTERVYKPYSFSTLPGIIRGVATELLKVE
ncbi:M20/M25/M40 family metallo-hydrolase [Bacillus salacetis]|uniref:M20/M25/M40 family metallo-hydrolase n=2 Tax=Bacillus salacetis TaxID=2315464 RepID=A0A3A1QR53_9BACI|nr:M20/M25/M40 family metallo-hydrolase [Bacillus salacetis]RIW29601.1 M20/M25/M40 family metallo-hydrolase [Bacillus salacetis]